MMSSVNHDDFAHLEIPLENILTATNSFKNVVGGNGFVKYYKGELLLSGELINILAERLNKEWFDGERQFWMEVSLLSSLKHKNLISLVRFCDDNDEKVIIYKSETRASLSKYLSDSMSLTWVRRLEISVGIAHALSYIHYDEKSVTQFQDNKYLAPVAIFHYREKTLDDIINPDLWKQMDRRSLNVFAEIAYDCLNEERYQRPNIDETVTRLKKALELQLERENA
nr:protein kinase-like domain-containing protein [Tanacetum cinerariifolium]